MSASCVGTCSSCGVERFWLSNTMSLQLDDGRLVCLPHPAERWACEKEHGLTLGQASERGRLFRETFYVCRHCGREGETIHKQIATDWERPFSIRGATKWGWGSAVVVIPFLAWMQWWTALGVIGSTLLATPGIYWLENRKWAKGLAARGLPRADAPGRFPIAEPTAGLDPDSIIGRRITTDDAVAHPGRIIPRATGPCCDRPHWIDASSVSDEDGIPCRACGRGVMTVSQHMIH